MTIFSIGSVYLAWENMSILLVVFKQTPDWKLMSNCWVVDKGSEFLSFRRNGKMDPVPSLHSEQLSAGNAIRQKIVQWDDRDTSGLMVRQQTLTRQQTICRSNLRCTSYFVQETSDSVYGVPGRMVQIRPRSLLSHQEYHAGERKLVASWIQTPHWQTAS